MPRRLAQEHDREVECLRWPLDAGADEQWGPEVDLAERADEWVQPFLVAPVDVVVVEGVLDEGPSPTPSCARWGPAPWSRAASWSSRGRAT